MPGKVTITSEALNLLGCDKNLAKKAVNMMCSDHHISHSSFAHLSITNGQFIIATSLGSLITDKNLRISKKFEGKPVGTKPGRNRTGHRLPSSGYEVRLL